MFGLTRPRIFEIGVALLLTLAAIVFVGLTVWAAESGRIDVAGAWARPTLGEGRATAAYMTIANKGKHADVLKWAHTRKAKSVEMRQLTTTSDGIVQVRKVEGGLPIAAGGSIVLGPDGTHLMLVGLEDALEAGEDVILTLEFAHAGAVDVHVPIKASAETADADAAQ
jgi:periplasmic copper chaperone A